jgi:hypothetical protein
MKSTIFWDVTVYSGRILRMFRKNILPPSSGSKSKPNDQPARIKQEAERELPRKALLKYRPERSSDRTNRIKEKSVKFPFHFTALRCSLKCPEETVHKSRGLSGWSSETDGRFNTVFSCVNCNPTMKWDGNENNIETFVPGNDCNYIVMNSHACHISVYPR